MANPQLSQSAYDKLQAEFTDLTTRGRIEVANKIEVAREEGDLKENAGYHAAKDEQGHMEGRIRQLEHLLENAEIVEASLIYTIVYDGDSDDMAERYMIGNMEEDAPDADVISSTSPLGAALDGASEGDVVTYDAPNGSLTVKVLKVETH
ncbi:transcription elongation factor GreA [Ilumatobacter coccineus]|jgi:transcription elongation factor GreA|uniref:Transcription elongation factor GreA n=1 Tax=Ilumatobacter coccineus (strain NBRC 103263 / KCTC 29153 / YM16-304) TaxID=1313172 RepID=A0A6C7E4U6_ILUCY|nr:transcription elongation factor GreA [Ilumatobacter coccineus]BAN01611.1 transcription elongation factor GreA [Ilumatobacter coccineus YM16-304]